jgi:putative ABC transport system ATP-binding protein
MTLHLDDVRLTVGDGDDTFHAVDEVTLTVAPGEVVALLGPSGSGKSSLLALAGGLVTPTAGRVRIAEVDLTAVAARERDTVRRERIGMVFQSVNLFGSLTALEQLLLVSHIRGVRPAADRDRALELLAEVGMADRADRRPHELSGGERQRIGIARALFGEPTVLLADEPTAALDTERTHEVAQLLVREAHQHRAATLIATHDPEVVGYADRVVEIRDGRLVDDRVPPAPARSGH